MSRVQHIPPVAKAFGGRPGVAAAPSSAPPTAASPSGTTSTVARAAACGDGADALVTGSQSSGFVATYHGQTVYQGEYYITAIWEAIGALDPSRTSQEKVSVMASAWIGNNTIDLPSHTALEVCGTLDTGYVAGRGAIERDLPGSSNVRIDSAFASGMPGEQRQQLDPHRELLGHHHRGRDRQRGRRGAACRTFRVPRQPEHPHRAPCGQHLRA